MSRKTIPSNVKEFSPVIYPRLLWVAKSLDNLGDYFVFLSNSNSDKEVSFEDMVDDIDNGGGIMVTCKVMRKSDNKLGVMVIFVDLDDFNPSVIPHEAVHVADYYYEQLGMYTQNFCDGNESYAYLVGWAGGCISKTVSELKAEEYDD